MQRCSRYGCAEVLIKCRGSAEVVQRCRDAEVQRRCRGAEMQGCRDAEMQRCSVQRWCRYGGDKVQMMRRRRNWRKISTSTGGLR